MATTFGTKLYTRLPAKGDLNWDDEVNDNMAAFEDALCPELVYWVAPDFTTTNLKNGSATDRRHFPTIQEAIDFAEALGTIGYDDGYTIFVYPGTYSEHLTIELSVSIIGMTPMFAPFGCPHHVILNGSTTVRDSLLTLNPQDSEYLRVSLANLAFNNAFNQSDAVKAGEYVCHAANQPSTYPSTHNSFQMVNCIGRLQTWGAGPNKWNDAFLFDGWWKVYIDRCSFAPLNSGGGTGEGYIENLFRFDGDVSGGKSSYGYFRDCYLTNNEPATPVGVYTFAGDNNSVIEAHRCTMGQDDPDATDTGGTGTNTTEGLSGAEIATNFNLFNADWTRIV